MRPNYSESRGDLAPKTPEVAETGQPREGFDAPYYGVPAALLDKMLDGGKTAETQKTRPSSFDPDKPEKSPIESKMEKVGGGLEPLSAADLRAEADWSRGPHTGALTQEFSIPEPGEAGAEAEGPLHRFFKRLFGASEGQ